MKRKIVIILLLALLLSGCGDTVIFLPDAPAEVLTVPLAREELPTDAAPETETQIPVPAVPEETEAAKIRHSTKTQSSPSKGKDETEATAGSITVTEPKATEPKETAPAPTEPKETKPPATESVQLRPTQPVTAAPAETEPPATEAAVISATDPVETVPVSTKPKETEPPATNPPATEPPITEPPETKPPETAPPVTEPERYDISGYTVGNLEYRILDRINEYRAEAGLEEMYLDSYLCAIASCRGYEASLVWSHTRPDGRHFDTVLDDYGYGADGAKELLAYASADAQTVVDKWMSSESHRAILLGDCTTLGVGIYRTNGYTFAACLIVG